MTTTRSLQLAGRSQCLASLRRRLREKLLPAETVQVTHPADVNLLADMSHTDLLKFARSCDAYVVPRVGRRLFEFTHAGSF